MGPRPLPAPQKWRSQGVGVQRGGMEKRGDAGEPSVKMLWGSTLGGPCVCVREQACGGVTLPSSRQIPSWKPSPSPSCVAFV